MTDIYEEAAKEVFNLLYEKGMPRTPGCFKFACKEIESILREAFPPPSDDAKKLITAFGNAALDCGEWDEDDDMGHPYKYFLAIEHEASDKLQSHIATLERECAELKRIIKRCEELECYPHECPDLDDEREEE